MEKGVGRSYDPQILSNHPYNLKGNTPYGNFDKTVLTFQLLQGFPLFGIGGGKVKSCDPLQSIVAHFCGLKQSPSRQLQPLSL